MVDGQCALCGDQPWEAELCVPGQHGGMGEHPEMGLPTVEMTQSEHLRGDSTTANHPR